MDWDKALAPLETGQRKIRMKKICKENTMSSVPTAAGDRHTSRVIGAECPTDSQDRADMQEIFNEGLASTVTLTESQPTQFPEV